LLSFSAVAQEIALTFDDAPGSGGAVFTGMQWTSKIIEIMKAFDVKQAAFFVVTFQVNEDNVPRLKMYSAISLPTTHTLA
jgi:peptidoglycan-N-acetylglucosamine deacetylase